MWMVSQSGKSNLLDPSDEFFILITDTRPPSRVLYLTLNKVDSRAEGGGGCLGGLPCCLGSAVFGSLCLCSDPIKCENRGQAWGPAHHRSAPPDHPAKQANIWAEGDLSARTSPALPCTSGTEQQTQTRVSGQTQFTLLQLGEAWRDCEWKKHHFLSTSTTLPVVNDGSGSLESSVSGCDDTNTSWNSDEN